MLSMLDNCNKILLLKCMAIGEAGAGGMAALNAAVVGPRPGAGLATILHNHMEDEAAPALPGRVGAATHTHAQVSVPKDFFSHSGELKRVVLGL